MTASDNLSAIEKALEGVTPGPWRRGDLRYGGRYSLVEAEHLRSGFVCEVMNHNASEANAAYIAACSPDRISTLLALARKAGALEREIAELREALRPFADVADLVDSETEGVSDSDEFQMHFHDYLMASWKLSIFRRARSLLSQEAADAQG